MRSIVRLLRHQRGVGAIEYAVVASLISVAGIAAFQHLGSGVSAKYEQVDNKL